MMQKRDSAPLILTAAFVLLVLGLNFQIFTRPAVEFGDAAANSLLVQEARHFTLLTGHYSRMRFHHPGPAFLYLFALGEFLFYDLLHVVPAPYNGQLLIAIIFNGILLSAALCVFRRHVKLSIPLALLVTLVVSIIIGISGQSPMLVSEWMPDVLLFPFLLFAVSAASVLAGETRDLRYLAFSGMLLIHAHFAQFLFVGVIGGATVGYILVRAQRQRRLHLFFSERWRDFAWAAAIVFVFALPPLLEIALHKPNNLDAVLAYQQRTGNMRNNLGMAIGYLACFLLFVSLPELALREGPVGVLAMGLSRPVVVVYWLVLALVFLLAIVAWRRTAKQQRATFLKSLTWVGAAIVLLFLYWGTRIVGEFYAFNGNFIYALHLLIWFVLLAAIEPLLNWRATRILNVLAVVTLITLGILERKVLLAVMESRPDVLQAATAAPLSPFGKLAITFDRDNWPWAVGVANSMKRMGKPFCVSPGWGFMFSRDNVCPDMLTADDLSLTTGVTHCTLPCRYVYRSVDFSLTRDPAQPLTLPVEVGLRDSPGLDSTGFYEVEGVYRWSQKHASIRFRLAPERSPAPCFRIALTGFAYPGRPMQLSVNGRILGTLSKNVSDKALFVVPPEAIHPGEVNRISLDTEKAGPVGADWRDIGFGFAGLDLRAAAPDESCAIDTAAQPDYGSINVDWAPSCYGVEGTPPHQWRWCGPDSLVTIHNSSSKARRMTLSADLSTGQEKAAPLKIRSPFFEDTVAVSDHRLAYTRTFMAPPGDSTIVFTCLAPRSGIGRDPRNLVLRFENFRLDSTPLPQTADRKN